MAEVLNLAPPGVDATRTKANLASIAMLHGRNTEAADLLNSSAREFALLGDMEEQADSKEITRRLFMIRLRAAIGTSTRS